MASSLLSVWKIARWVLVALLFITGVWGIPGTVAEQWALLSSLDGEWIIRGAALVLAAIIALAAIGRERLQGLGTLLSPRAEREEQHAQDAALQAYLHQMQQWIDDEKRPVHHSQPGDNRRRMARTQTLAVLRRLGPEGKRHVLEFLHDHDLIDKGDPIVRLARADFSGAHLASIQLTHIDLEFANLSGADLSDARLSALVTTSGGVDMAQQKGVHGRDFDIAIATTKLPRANLSGAVLRETRLAGCDLTFADFAGADLKDADLRAADLRAAHNLTQKQLNKAYGTYQQELVPDTKLPDCLQVPAAWRKPISEQRKDSERSRGVFRRLARLLRFRD